MKRRTIPIYRLAVYFSNSEDLARAFLKAHGQDEDEIDELMKDINGLYYSFEDKNDKTWRMMCVFNGDPSVVAHESVHAAIDIADTLGMTINFENSEPVCYLTQWFFETMLELYPPRPKPKAPAPIKEMDGAA